MDLLKNPQKYRKLYSTLIGSLVTWAVATFPNNHNVQLYGSLVAVLLTCISTYQVKNEEL